MKNSRRVVITGLGVVAPNGIGKETFWQNLIAGKSAIDYITAFDASPLPLPGGRGDTGLRPEGVHDSSQGEGNGPILPTGSGRYTSCPRRCKLDHRQRCDMSQDRIFYGTSINGGGDVAATALENLLHGGVTAIDPWAALEYPPHAPSSYIAIEFGIQGPALSVSSNCCAGIDAINEGFRHIAEGSSSVAVVGGCDAPIFPLWFGAFCALGALTKRNDAPQKASRPYDGLRDGIVISEGAATLILEELEFAQERGARIYGEVLGHGSASEAIGMRKGDLSGKRNGFGDRRSHSSRRASS